MKGIECKKGLSFALYFTIKAMCKSFQQQLKYTHTNTPSLTILPYIYFIHFVHFQCKYFESFIILVHPFGWTLVAMLSYCYAISSEASVVRRLNVHDLHIRRSFADANLLPHEYLNGSFYSKEIYLEAFRW